MSEIEYVEDGALVESTSTYHYVAENGSELIEPQISDAATLRVYNENDEEWREVKWQFERGKPARLYYAD